MPGKNHRFTLEQDKIAKSISKEYRKKGYSKEESNRIAYSTINKIRSH